MRVFQHELVSNLKKKKGLKHYAPSLLHILDVQQFVDKQL